MRLEGVFELAQALIQCTDARLQQTYRGEDRTWRSQDCDWRVVDRQLTTAFMYVCSDAYYQAVVMGHILHARGTCCVCTCGK